jgi:membrane-associated phospholipid phosphatase
VLTVFLCATILATVYLGWHFAVDDVAGVAIAWVSVQLGRWIIHPMAKEGKPSLIVVEPTS